MTDIKAIRVARAIALLTAPWLPACGAPAVSPTLAMPISSDSASSAHVTTVATVAVDDGDRTEGPCRCSWTRHADLALRICKRGEEDTSGQLCKVAGVRRRRYPITKGPLPPPDLPMF